MIPEFPQRWRLLRDRPRSPLENMAIDEMLLQELESGFGQPTIRLYRWDRPTISLGRHQDPYEVLDTDACEEWGVPWISRPSGGKLVFHGEDLTYSIVTYKHSIETAGLLFEKVNTVWALALQRLGLPAFMAATATDGGGTDDCFSTQAIHEVVLSGSKVLGSAQRVLRQAILQHGSLLTNRDPEHVRQFLQPEHRGPMPDLAPFPGEWTFDLFHQAEVLFLEEFRKEFDAIVIQDVFSRREEEYLMSLRAASYA